MFSYVSLMIDVVTRKIDQYLLGWAWNAEDILSNVISCYQQVNSSSVKRLENMFYYWFCIRRINRHLSLCEFELMQHTWDDKEEMLYIKKSRNITYKSST